MGLILDSSVLMAADEVFTLARAAKDAHGSYCGGKEKLTIPIDNSGHGSYIQTIIKAILSDTGGSKFDGSTAC